jgi:alkaline phosphatase
MHLHIIFMRSLSNINRRTAILLIIFGGYMKKKTRLYIMILSALIVLPLTITGIAQSRAASAKYYNGPKAKYVFLFIGDGMAAPQINAAEAYLSAKESKTPGVKRLTFPQMSAQGMMTTYDAGRYITDSASAGTAMYTGNKTLDGVISMDVSKTKKYTTIFESAKKSGMKVGIVSSVSLDHATPACAYAHQASRNDYYEISLQLAQSGFDYFAGGGLKDPDGKKSKMQGDKPNAIEQAKKAGYKYFDNTLDIMNLHPGTGKVLAISSKLDADKALAYSMDMKENDLTLADFTKKGIELLDNPRGFLMMVEGGKIDWSAHANDAAATINDVIAFDEAVKTALEFYRKRSSETVIIVTGDHETGGMTLGFAGTKYETAFDKIAQQKSSFQAFDEIFIKFKKENPSGSFDEFYPQIQKYFGLGTNDLKLSQRETKRIEQAFKDSMKKDKNALANDEEGYLLYGGYEPISVTLTQILNQKAGIAWTTYSHTGVPVPVFSTGTGSEIFRGYYDNTDIASYIRTITNIK